MRASTFPRAFRLYDHDAKRMYYPEELFQLKIGITSLGEPIFGDKIIMNSTIQWFSGQFDQNKVPLFEGDICRVGMKNDFGSYTEGYAVMRWAKETTQFILAIHNNKAGKMLAIHSCVRIGDEFSNEDLIIKVNGN